MTEFDHAQLSALTNCFVDIVEVRIPAFRRQHGVGSLVEWNVINMWRAALDCIERCAVLAQTDPPTRQAFERRAAAVRKIIENAEVGYTAWIETEAWLESEHQTKH